LRQAFYRGSPEDLSQPPTSWVKAFEQPVQFRGLYQTTARSQVLCDPILVLNFILTSINPVGSPSHIVSEILRGFLGEGLWFEEISFNIGSTKLVRMHQQAIDQLMHRVAQ